MATLGVETSSFCGFGLRKYAHCYKRVDSNIVACKAQMRSSYNQRKCSSMQCKLKVRCQAAEAVTVGNSTVLVAGGGGLGMEVARQLVKAGSWVTVFQRSGKFQREIEDLGAMLAIGDVLDASTIDKAFSSNSFDAVVCTVGGGTKDANVDKDGPINLISSSKAAGVKRFILVSSIGVGNSMQAVDQKTLEILRPVLEAKEVAEENLKSSGLAYSIIRPGGLLNKPPTGNGILSEDPNTIGVISRSDVATLILKILFDRETEMKTFSAIDPGLRFPS